MASHDLSCQHRCADAFSTLYTASHHGIRATKNLIASKFVWHGLRKQVTEWARTCISCQTAKIHRHVKAPLGTFEAPRRRFDHVHLDILGPLPPSRGFNYLFTIVDRYTRWPEAIPLSDTSTLSCARALIAHWIARFVSFILRSRSTVHFRSLVIRRETLRNTVTPHHCIPPSSQRVSGALSPAHEGSSAGTAHRSRLGR